VIIGKIGTASGAERKDQTKTEELESS